MARFREWSPVAALVSPQQRVWRRGGVACFPVVLRSTSWTVSTSHAVETIMHAHVSASLLPLRCPLMDKQPRKFAHLTSCVHCSSARGWSVRGDAHRALRPCCERHTTQQTGFVYRLYPVCTYVLGPEKDQRGMQWMFKESIQFMRGFHRPAEQLRERWLLMNSTARPTYASYCAWLALASYSSSDPRPGVSC